MQYLTPEFFRTKFDEAWANFDINEMPKGFANVYPNNASNCYYNIYPNYLTLRRNNLLIQLNETMAAYNYTEPWYTFNPDMPIDICNYGKSKITRVYNQFKDAPAKPSPLQLVLLKPNQVQMSITLPNPHNSPITSVVIEKFDGVDWQPLPETITGPFPFDHLPLSIQDTSVIAGSSVQYRFYAVNALGNGQLSDPLSVTIPQFPPTAVPTASPSPSSTPTASDVPTSTPIGTATTTTTSSTTGVIDSTTTTTTSSSATTTGLASSTTVGDSTVGSVSSEVMVNSAILYPL
eukprot:TRINITY_DN571_c0_g1_i8.p1 TRINITY_DN571_c0_g1~~TRINITY_DN571_c0_g1_i8.p1  ORF type:complete len:291 (+),score=23.83 TRINITY_DN571_c0_g1_i8:43-915(+)